MAGSGGGFVVSREAGRVIVGFCIALPAATLFVRYWSFDPAAPYERNAMNPSELPAQPGFSPSLASSDPQQGHS